MNDFIFYDYLYKKEDIDKLNEICKNVDWVRTKPLNADITNRFVSSCDLILDTRIIIHAYLSYVPELVARSLDHGLRKSNGCFPDVKLSKYDSSHFYDWHCDCWQTNNNLVGRKRQLSSITYLNDDYEGGETEFDCGVTIKPTAGKTLIFPSTWVFPHRGNKVISGTKYIYINHIWV
jgi:hypothetical protein